MMKSNALTMFCTAMITAGLSLSAYGASFPKSIEGMTSKTAAEMKDYPDVKVKLGKPLSESDLKGKSEVELTLMRNSIFAQAAMPFSEPWLKSYFLSRKWYKEGAFNAAALTAVDHANAHMIIAYQKKHNLASTNSFASRHVAAIDTPTKLRGDELAKRVVRMKFCDLISEGDYIFTLTFHANNKVTAQRLSENGPYGDSYGSSYGDQSGSGYGYDGGHSGASEGTWVVADNHLVVTIAKQQTKLYFGTRSYYQHRCYDDPNGPLN